MTTIKDMIENLVYQLNIYGVLILKKRYFHFLLNFMGIQINTIRSVVYVSKINLDSQDL